MNKGKGSIYLVGAGTGRIGDLTVRAKELIETADIIFYDRLVNPNIIKLKKGKCKTVYVGKKPGEKNISQETIIKKLKESTKDFKIIVRLKSGDPYVYGRGGEEALELTNEGYSVEVIPGITSAIAGLSYGGIPITYRDIALDFHVFTAHSKDGKAIYDWEAISSLEGTLVFMMGVKLLPYITKKLLESGKSKTTPIALIQWASRSKQQKVVGDLSNIVEKVKSSKIGSPAVIVIGDVVKFESELNFFEQGSLMSKTIAIATSSKRYLLPKLENLGAEVVLFDSPQTNYQALDFELTDFPLDLYLLDTSAVNSFLEWLANKKIDWRKLENIKLISGSEHVTKKLNQIGIIPDKIIIDLDKLKEKNFNKAEKLIGKKEFIESLFGKEYTKEPFVQATSYETYPVLKNFKLLEEADTVIFHNTKAVRGLLNGIGSDEQLDIMKEKLVYCLGDNTKFLLEQENFKNIIQTTEPNYESLIESLIYREECSQCKKKL